GYAPVEDAGVAMRRAGLIDAGRPPGQDEAFRTERQNLINWRVVRKNQAADFGLPHSPGDELSVLGPEVEHDYGVDRRRTDSGLRAPGFHGKPRGSFPVPGARCPMPGIHLPWPTFCANCIPLPSV